MNPVNRKRFQKHVSRLYTQMSSMCGSSEGVHRPDWPHRAAPAPPSGHIDSLIDWLTVNWSQPRAVNCCSSPAGQWRHVDSITAAVTADNCWVSVSACVGCFHRWESISLLTSASLNLLLQTHHCVCMCVCVCLSSRRYLFIIFRHLSPPTQHVETVTNKKANRRKKKYFYWGICLSCCYHDNTELPVMQVTVNQSSGRQLQGNILS